MAVAAAVPFVSLAIGRMPHFWIIPFVALGNAAMVFAFWQICRKKMLGPSFSLNWAAASLAGSLSKFLVLHFGVAGIFVNFIPLNEAALAAISFNYSFPQLATASIGCLLVFAIYPAIKKAMPESAEK
jgi:hypothetical protein